MTRCREKHVSWAYFGDQFNRYLADKYQKNPEDEYCNICNWAQYSTAIMTNPAARAEHLKDTTRPLRRHRRVATLPAVSYVKPSGIVDGHPSSSKLDLCSKASSRRSSTPCAAIRSCGKSTAIFVTFDEGGGYWDSGYVQTVDFFGDGTRIPMIVVSKYSRGGHISTATPITSPTLKFIEANWALKPGKGGIAHLVRQASGRRRTFRRRGGAASITTADPGHHSRQPQAPIVPIPRCTSCLSSS